MLGERKSDEAIVKVFNSDGTVITNEKIAVSNGRFKANFPKDKEVQVIYWTDQIKPNRAARRKKKRGDFK